MTSKKFHLKEGTNGAADSGTLLEPGFLRWMKSISEVLGELGRRNRVLTALVVALPLVAWTVLSPATLVVFLIGSSLLVVLVRRERIWGRGGRWVLGIVMLAFFLRCFAGFVHYRYASSHGMGIDFFGDANAYSSTGQVVAENLRAAALGKRVRWPVIDGTEKDWLYLLRSQYGWNLPDYHLYRIGLFGYILGIHYALLGLSPLSIKFLHGLIGVLIAWLVFRFLRLEGLVRAAPLALIATAFYPSLFFWSVTGLRETWIFLLSLILLGLYVRGDSAKRVAFQVSAIGFLALGKGIVVVAAIPLIVRAVASKYRIVGKSTHKANREREDNQYEVREVSSNLISLIKRASLEEHLKKLDLNLSFWGLLTGALGITALNEFRKVPAVVICFVFVIPLLFNLFVKAKSLGTLQVQGKVQLSSRGKVVALALLPVVLAGSVWVGWVAQRKIQYYTYIIPFVQRQLALNARTAIHIYPERYYEYEKNSAELWSEINNGTFKTATHIQMLSGAAKGLVYNLFAPFPFSQGPLEHIAASAQMVLLYGIYMLAVVGGVVSYKRVGSRYWPFWAFLGIGLLASSFIEGNVGTIFRHRDIFTPVLIAGAAIGLVELLKWFEERGGKSISLFRTVMGPSPGLGQERWSVPEEAPHKAKGRLIQPSPLVLYLSYNSFSEPVFQSQALAYLKNLAPRGIRFLLISFEKPEMEIPKDKASHLKEDLEATGISWLPRRYHKHPRFLSTLYDQTVGTLVCTWHLATRPVDWVHARGVTPAAMALLPARLFRCPLVFDMRSSLAEAYADAEIWKRGGLWYRLVRWTEALTIGKADSVVVETEAHKSLILQALGKPAFAEKVKVIPCCVDMDRFDDLASPAEDEPWELIYMGSLSGWYRFKEMLAFYMQAREIWGPGRLAFLTKGPEKEVRQWAKDAGIPDDELSVEDLAFEDVPRRLARGRLGIVFTTPGRRLESFPVKVGEYLAAGLPIAINAGMGDTEEVVRSLGVGVVANDFSEESYKRAIIELDALSLSDDSLALKCREVARELLSLESGADKYWTIYTEGHAIPSGPAPPLARPVLN